MHFNRNFSSSVNFKGSGQFLNPTRDNIKSILKENDRIVLARTASYKPAAIFMTTGVMHNCNLSAPTYQMTTRVKKILVVPLAYEYERLLGFLGLCFDKQQLYGAVNAELTLAFSTRKEAGTSQGKVSATSLCHCLISSYERCLPNVPKERRQILCEGQTRGILHLLWSQLPECAQFRRFGYVHTPAWFRNIKNGPEMSKIEFIQST